MKAVIICFLVLSFGCACWSHSLHATLGPSAAEMAKISGYEQKIGSVVPLDASFLDENAQSVTIRKVLANASRPVVLILGYSNCPTLCSAVLSGLVQTLNDLKWSAGQEFDLIDLSIDPRQSADQSLLQKRMYLKRYRRSTAEAGWHFLSSANGSNDEIKKVADAVGFHYFYDDHSKQYAHPSGIVILTPKGVVSQYLLGASFSAQQLHDALKIAGQEKTGSPIENLLLLCFHYNPATGKYGMLIMNLMKAGGVVTLLFLGGGIVWLIRRNQIS